MPAPVLIFVLVILSIPTLMFYWPRFISPIKYPWQQGLYFSIFAFVWIAFILWIIIAANQPVQYSREYESQIYKIEDKKYLMLDTGVLIPMNENTPEGKVLIKVPFTFYYGIEFGHPNSIERICRKFQGRFHQFELEHK